jgi:hypothetical protein
MVRPGPDKGTAWVTQFRLLDCHTTSYVKAVYDIIYSVLFSGETFMKQYWYFLFLTLFGCSSASNTPSYPPLTEQSVFNMMRSFEAAYAAHDAEGLASHYSKDYKSTYDMGEENDHKITMGLSEVLSQFTGQWSSDAEFTIEKQDEVITVASDGKSAVVTSLDIQTIQLDEDILAITHSKGTLTVKSFNGTPKITDSYAVFISVQTSPQIELPVNR